MKEREHALDSLADALEVIISLARAEGASIEDVERLRKQKEIGAVDLKEGFIY